jgi:two-component system, OmpR family, sensor kinase
MNIRKSIRSARFILSFWYSALLLVALTLFGVSVYLFLQHLQESQLDQYLNEEADWIAEVAHLERHRIGTRPLDSISQEIEGSIDEHFSRGRHNVIVVLATMEGRLLYQSDRRGPSVLSAFPLATPGAHQKTVQAGAYGDLRIVARHDAPFLIYVGVAEAVAHVAGKNLISIFVVIAPVMLFVAFASGWVMAGMVLRPVRQISSMATRITALNLSERIPVRDVEDELGTLIRTMNAMISRLQTSFEEMRLFSLNVAHELRTPLAILKGQSELALSNPPSPDETQELVTSYLEETIRMSRIVDDLLMLAKAETGQLTVERGPVHMDVLVGDLHEDGTILAGSKDLFLRLGHVDPVVVTGDAARLRQLFRILLTNALQYTNPGGEIRIACVRNDGNVFVSIEDTGIGIPADSLERVFDRFYRVDQARTRVKGGSGLGLALAKWIVEAHHGTINVHSTVDKGSTFTVALPVATVEQMEELSAHPR